MDTFGSTVAICVFSKDGEIIMARQFMVVYDKVIGERETGRD